MSFPPDPDDPPGSYYVRHTPEEDAERKAWENNRAKYAFNRAFQKAILKALGLWDRSVRKLTLEMEVNKPVILTVECYATLASPDALANIFELAEFKPAPVNQLYPPPPPTPDIEISVEIQEGGRQPKPVTKDLN